MCAFHGYLRGCALVPLCECEEAGGKPLGVDWPPKNATRDVLVFSPQTQLVRDHLSLSTPLPAVGLGNNSIPSQLRLYRLTGQEAPLLACLRPRSFGHLACATSKIWEMKILGSFDGTRSLDLLIPAFPLAGHQSNRAITGSYYVARSY